MVRRRDCLGGVGAEIRVIHDRVKVAREQPAANEIVEPPGPVIGEIVLVTTEHAKVVDDVATTKNEHALVAQGGKPLGELEMKAWWLGDIHAELQHGDVCGRVGLAENGPRPVIEAPLPTVEYDGKRS